MLAVLRCVRFNGDAVHLPLNASFSAAEPHGRERIEVELA
jgi:hypothetical protein